MKQWDIFISHASEDKESVAIPLANALRRAGLKVWLDQQEIKLGDSIREKIDDGLARSRFGIVIVSKSFLEKGWPKRELNGLMAIEEDGKKVILPVWHNIDRTILINYSPILADRLAANTDQGISVVADTITSVVLYNGSESPSTLHPSVSRRFIELLETGSELSKIRDFLSSHPKVLAKAVGASYKPLVITPSEINGFRPDFCVGNYKPTGEKYEWSILVLGSPLGPLFEQGNTPIQDIADKVAQLECLLKSRRNLDRVLGRHLASEIANFLVRSSSPLNVISEWYPWCRGIIVAGRRDRLTSIDNNRLRNYNDYLRQLYEGNKYLHGIQMRTYDWIIDASIDIETTS